MPEFRFQDITKLVGRTVGNLRFWVDQGIIIPDIVPSQGKGVRRIFSSRNLIEFMMLHIMTKDLFVPLEISKVIFEHLRRGHDEEDLEIEKWYPSPHFEDFYTNSEWGGTKDLIFNFHVAYEPEEKKIYRYHLYSMVKYAEGASKKTKKGSAVTLGDGGQRVFFPNTLENRSLLLGTIKRLAAERLFVR